MKKYCIYMLTNWNWDDLNDMLLQRSLTSFEMTA